MPIVSGARGKKGLKQTQIKWPGRRRSRCRTLSCFPTSLCSFLKRKDKIDKGKIQWYDNSDPCTMKSYWTSSISNVATPIHIFGACFLPESSSLIGQFTGSGHYFYVTDDLRFSNSHKYFSNRKRKLLVIHVVKLKTNHDHFFSQYFLSEL